jgi:hypothetical protein
VELVPASQKHVEEYYGGKPIMSVRGIVGLLDGKVVGIAGVCFDHDNIIVFSEFKEEARKYKKSIVKAALMVYEIMQRYSIVYAVANKQEKGAKRLMARFGFEFVEVNSEGEEVYRWLKWRQ